MTTEYKYLTRATKVTISPEKEPIFSELSTHISIEDEAAGEFIKVEQVDNGFITIDREEWPIIKAEIDKIVKALKPYE